MHMMHMIMIISQAFKESDSSSKKSNLQQRHSIQEQWVPSETNNFICKWAPGSISEQTLECTWEMICMQRSFFFSFFFNFFIDSFFLLHFFCKINMVWCTWCRHDWQAVHLWTQDRNFGSNSDHNHLKPKVNWSTVIWTQSEEPSHQRSNLKFSPGFRNKRNPLINTGVKPPASRNNDP
jgi:hypothetical protein